jgi:hypothetical protein
MKLYYLDGYDCSSTILEVGELDYLLLPEKPNSMNIISKVLPSLPFKVDFASGVPVVIGGGVGCCAVGTGFSR